MAVISRADSLVRLLAGMLLAALAAGSASAQSKPNIIVMVADDAGYADWGFMDQLTGQTTEFKTPNLDALAQRGNLLSNAYVTSPACAPSRAGLLTGRYQERVGIDYNFGNGNTTRDGTPVSELMLSEALKPLGYSTGAFGKWHQGIHTSQQPLNQGFDEFYGFFEGSRPHFEIGVGSLVRRGANPIAWQNEPSFNNVPPDPVLGRHLGDAIGDEASKYVANHANQANPFFMYVAFNGPHSPYDLAKQQDLALFDSTSLTGYRKNAAALTYAVDRNVGNILARVNDPNGDGDMSDSIADNTIIVFLNDNGAPSSGDPAAAGQVVHSNAPLQGFKGGALEGGIRVPMIISLPGVDSGVFNQPVSSFDFFPTLLEAAGGAPAANIDGVDLTPYLTGEQSGPVHDKLMFRMGINGWAIRKGDWKLARGNSEQSIRLYKLSPNGTGELNNLAAANPDKFRELTIDYVDWEAEMGKGSQTTIRALNQFDEFLFRTDVGQNAAWRDASVWRNNAAQTSIVTMGREDSYANAVLAFHPRNDASYTSTNNISRTSGQSYTVIANGNPNPDGFREFMLNALRFDGDFSGAADQSATLQGEPLLFVRSLTGQGPKISLNSTRTGQKSFAFNVNMDVVLHADLEIGGNSVLGYAINGRIRDFNGPRSMTKTGSATLTLAGNNTYAGETVVSGGTLRIDGASAALANTSKVRIGAQGVLALASGRIHTPAVEIAPGGAFNFTGGILETAQISGNLINAGGTLRPGLSTGSVVVSGSFAQTAGKLSVELAGVAAGTQYDRILAASAALGGQLEVVLASGGSGLFTPALGNSFEIVKTTGALTGTFSSVIVPTLPFGRRWAIDYGGDSVLLHVVAGLTADFDDNNVVDSADLSIWRLAVGTSSFGDADLDGDTDGSDFLVWQRQVGMQLLPAAVHASAPVPECGASLLAAIGATAGLASRRRRFRCALA